MSPARKDRGAMAGTSFVELVLGLTVIVLLMGAVIVSGDLVQRTLTDRRGDVLEAMRRAGVQLAQHLRPARRSSLQVRATEADAAILAVEPGQWIEAPVGIPRGSLRFETTHGEQASAGRVELELVLDRNELANAQDDDGDGLVDEGSLQARIGSASLALLSETESCTFGHDGRLVHVVMVCARRGDGGNVVRARTEHFVMLRNE